MLDELSRSFPPVHTPGHHYGKNSLRHIDARETHSLSRHGVRNINPVLPTPRLKARIRLLGRRLKLYRMHNIRHAIQLSRDMITAESTINRAAICLRVIFSTQGRMPVTYFVI